MSTAPKTIPNIIEIPSLVPSKKQITKPSQFIDAAVKLLDKVGWCTGAAGWGKDDGLGLCVLGALSHISKPAHLRGDKPFDRLHQAQSFFIFPEFHSAETLRLARIQNEVEFLIAYELPGDKPLLNLMDPPHRIWNWNDNQRFQVHSIFSKNIEKKAYKKRVRPFLTDLRDKLASEGR